MMGAGTIGFMVSILLLMFNTYGIWKQMLESYDIPPVPFVIVGCSGLAILYWFWGFAFERVGLYKEYQNHANSEVNPQWARAYKLIEMTAKSNGVDTDEVKE